MDNINVGFFRTVSASIVASLLEIKTKLNDGSPLPIGEVRKMSGAFNIIGMQLLVNLMIDLKRGLEKISLNDARQKETSLLVLSFIDSLEDYMNTVLNFGIDKPTIMFESYKKMKYDVDGKANSYKELDLFYPDVSLHELNFTTVVMTEDDEDFLVNIGIEKVKAFSNKINSSSMLEKTTALSELVKAISALIDTKEKKHHYYYLKCIRSFFDIIKSGDLFGKEEYTPYLNLITKNLLTELQSYENLVPNYDRFKEVLFYIGKIKTESQEALEMIDMFNLKDYMVLNPMTLSLITDTSIPQVNYRTIDKTLDELSGALSQMKIDWVGKVSSHPSNPKEFIQHSNIVISKIILLPIKSGIKIAHALKELNNKLNTSVLPPNDVLSQEIAYLVVLIELLIERKTKVSSSFDNVLDLQTKRLNAVLKGEVKLLNSLALPMIDEETKKSNVMSSLKLTVKEMQFELDRTQEIIENYIKTFGNEGTESLEKIVIDWGRINSRLSVLMYRDAIKLFTHSIAILKSVVEKKAVPTSSEMDELTTAVGGVNYFFESILKEDGQHLTILNPIIQKMFPGYKEEVIEDVTNVKLSSKKLKNKEVIGKESISSIDISEKESAWLNDSIEYVEVPNTNAIKVNEVTTKEIVNSSETGQRVRVVVDDSLLDSVSEDGMGLLDVFLEEAETIFVDFKNILSKFKKGEIYDIETAKRAFHTLKGGCNMIGLTNLGVCFSDSEDLMLRIKDAGKVLDKDSINAIDTLCGFFETWVIDIKHGQKAYVESNKVHDVLDEIRYLVFGEAKRVHAVVPNTFEITLEKPFEAIEINPIEVTVEELPYEVLIEKTLIKPIQIEDFKLGISDEPEELGLDGDSITIDETLFILEKTTPSVMQNAIEQGYEPSKMLNEKLTQVSSLDVIAALEVLQSFAKELAEMKMNITVMEFSLQSVIEKLSK